LLKPLRWYRRRKTAGTIALLQRSTANISTITNTSGLPKWKYAYLTNVTIKIGGEEVKNWTPTNTTTTVKTFSVKWDTTHFDPGNEEVECTATMRVERWSQAIFPDEPELLESADVGPAEASVTVEVYNRSFVAEIPFATDEFPSAATIDDYLRQIKHEHYLATDAVYGDCYDPLFDSTVYHFTGHGDVYPSSSFGDTGLDVTPNIAAWWLSTANVSAQRADALTASLPPMNFVFIDACLTGANSLMGTAFLYPASVAADHAAMGWRILTPFSWSPIFNDPFWHQMMDEATVIDARQIAYYALRTAALADDEMPDPPELVNDALRIVGDDLTKIAGLYGSSTLGTWYEVTG
jgi:hypothetical protein